MMMRCEHRSWLRALLVTSTVMSGIGAASPALAAGEPLEKRVERLEGLLEQILQRLEAQDGKINTQDQQILEQARTVVSQRQELEQKVAATDAKAEEVRKASASGDGFRVGKTRFKIGGYLKADFNATRYSDGDTAPEAVGDDFYLPQQIPVVPAASKSDGFDTNASARETRLWVSGETDVDGHKLSGRLEFDFQVVGTNATERATNNYSPMLRHAFIQWDNLLVGQTWSTFQNAEVLPDGIDYVGPTEGTVFVRQPQIRYTMGDVQIAIENPETVVTQASGAAVSSNDGALPDIVVRYVRKADFGQFTLAGLVRQLDCKNCVDTIDDSAMGYGLSAAGLIKVGASDDIRFMANAGRGIGRYIGINIVNDVAIRADGSLKPIDVYSGFVAYRHVWAPGLRSTLTGAFFKADNPVALTGGNVTDRVWSAQVNLLWSPVPQLTFGAEYIYAERQIESGWDGTMSRFQVSTKYAF